MTFFLDFYNIKISTYLQRAETLFFSFTRYLLQSCFHPSFHSLFNISITLFPCNLFAMHMTSSYISIAGILIPTPESSMRSLLKNNFHYICNLSYTYWTQERMSPEPGIHFCFITFFIYFLLLRLFLICLLLTCSINHDNFSNSS